MGKEAAGFILMILMSFREAKHSEGSGAMLQHVSPFFNSCLFSVFCLDMDAERLKTAEQFDPQPRHSKRAD